MSRGWIGALAFAALGCTPAAETEAPPEDPPALTPPDLSGIDLDAAIGDAVRRALTARADVVFAAHAAVLDAGTPSCPDRYVGTVPEGDPEIEAGYGWADHCAGETSFEGWAMWRVDARSQGDLADPAGRTTDASRRLEGALGVWAGGAPRLVFDGEVEDALSVQEVGSDTIWRWSSLLDGAVDGDAVGLPAMRVGMVIEARSAPAMVSARGEVYAPSAPLQTLFDSLRLDLSWTDPASSLSACPEEPTGWVGVRDDEAWWFDVVFQPLPGESDPTPGPCDGCGELYVRGLPTDQIVCPDLAEVWRVSPPPLSAFAPEPRVEVSP